MKDYWIRHGGGEQKQTCLLFRLRPLGEIVFDDVF